MSSFFLLAISAVATTVVPQSPSLVTSDKLGGDDRYLLYVSTDKPIYREGESVYLRSVFLNAADNTPIKAAAVNVSIKIRGPKGDTVFDGYADGDDSVAGMQWDIPKGMAGGVYTALVSSPNLGVTETERVFEIRAYRAPRLKTQIEFTRDGYGPGDIVQASVKAERAEGGFPDQAKVTVQARVDGKEVFNQTGFTLSDQGTLTTEFELPQFIEVGDGSLSFIIEDGGVVETASKTLPILLQNMDIRFYPESGDLVEGIESNVYLQAKRPDGKPADIKGRILEVPFKIPTDVAESVLQHGKEVSVINTTHEGRGIFSIKPVPRHAYVLILDDPSGIKKQFILPQAQSSGTVISSAQPVYSFDEDIVVGVDSVGENPAISLTLHKRAARTDAVMIEVGNDQVTLDPRESEGVLIVTAWNAKGDPVAERLIYRKPKFAVNIDVNVSEGPFVPGGEVSLEIVATDENGRPVEAVVGLTVTDDSVLELIDKREQAPRLPVMVYLENEVDELADAHVYLDANNLDAPEAVDLLLGTQGWRRFILMSYDDIKQKYPQKAKRVLAERLPVHVQKRFRNEILMQNEMAFPMAAAPPLDPDVGQLVPEPEEGIANDEPLEVAEEKIAFNVAKPEAMDIIDREMMPPMFMVREYAYQVRSNRKANDRIDFTETLYWNKGVRTSARDGKASVTFGLSDSVTTFRIMADGFGRNGALGVSDELISSIEPFYIEPKMPLEVTVGDVINLPVSVVNASDENISQANILLKGEGVTITPAKAMDLAAGERARQVIQIVAQQPGEFPLEFIAAAGPYADRVTRTLVVKPRGFPIAINHGGLLSSENTASIDITIPNEIEANSVVSIAKVYPSPLASMEEALNALLRQPHGCFEQTSSTNYPLVMAQQYFTTHQGVDPEKIATAKELLTTGYQQLIGFESEDNGYEWFGANPAHEALTAYGLMEFVDMAKVMSVDEGMIVRTREWLLDRRDGNGGFKRNELALDSFGRAPAPTTDAYIVWSLLESGQQTSTLKSEIEAVKKQAMATDDSYIIALAANILYLSGDHKAASQLAKKLADAVDKEGAIAGSVTSITQSGGDSLMIETTSLTLLAWLKDDQQWAAQVETSIKWLFERSKSGRFGSTQSTILALKAINAYDAARAVPKQAGSVQLLINGKAFGKPVAFTTDSKGAIELPDFSAALTAGKHTLALQMTDGSKMPFAIEVGYHTSLPVTSDRVALELETELSASQVTEGETVDMQVSVTVADKDAATPIAIIGIPAGLEVSHDQLKELVAADRISAYEVVGSEVILYWRALKASEKRVFPLRLEAAIPGIYTGPASRAYLYYTDEFKQWEQGHRLTIEAR